MNAHRDCQLVWSKERFNGIGIVKVMLDQFESATVGEALGISNSFLEKLKSSPVYGLASPISARDALVIVDVLDIDGIIHEDALGLDAVYIQAKRYAQDNRVGRPDIQRFIGSLTGEGATKGVFVTTSDFSKEAHEYLYRVQHRVVLINGQRLAQLMISHGVGARVRQTYLVQSVDEDYFSDAG